jgi:hypothetical protein
MRPTPEGDTVMPALTNTSEGVVVVTPPANPLVPKGMRPGDTRSYSRRVSVNYLYDPTDQKYSGTLSGTYTYVGTYQVTVPAGTFPAVMFRPASSARAKSVRPVRITLATTFLRRASGWS